MNSAVSCRNRHQPCNAEQIISGADQISVHLHSLATAVACFAQTAGGLHPAERFLDSFAYPLADRVTRMMSGPRIEGRASWPRIVLRHMGSDIERAATSDEVTGVKALITTQRDAATTRQPFVAHRHCRPPLGPAICRL